MKKVIGLLNCHDSFELGELTSARPLASTSFLGRYGFADFVLSNFCNSGIEDIGILVKDHQRSMFKHLGNMMSWVNNTKTGRATVFMNEQGALNPLYNTDLNNIRQNDWVLYDSDAEYLVIASPEYVMPIDFRPVVEQHIASGADVTVVYKNVEDAGKEFPSSTTFEIDENGKLLGIKGGNKDVKKAAVGLNCYVISRAALRKIMDDSKKVNAAFGIREVIGFDLQQGEINVQTYEYKGYVRCFASLKDYVKYSFELLSWPVRKELFKEDWPIYTVTHDTVPALYSETCKVSNSFVSNGCKVEGNVEGSVLCRNVIVGKGATIKNSIILSGVTVEEGATLENVVVDKYSRVQKNHTLAGDPENVIYVKQGALI